MVRLAGSVCDQHFWAGQPLMENDALAGLRHFLGTLSSGDVEGPTVPKPERVFRSCRDAPRDGSSARTRWEPVRGYAF